MCFFAFSVCLPSRCNVDSKVSRVAWLNRTTILFAGSEKWSLDPRVILMENTAVTEYSIKIQNVDVHDEGQYVCSILTNKKPKSTKVHLIVQGKKSPAVVLVFPGPCVPRVLYSPVLQLCSHMVLGSDIPFKFYVPSVRVRVRGLA